MNELEFFARTSLIITPIYSLRCCTCTSSSRTSHRWSFWHVIVLALFLDFFLNLLDLILLSIYQSLDRANLVLKRSSIDLTAAASSRSHLNRSLTLRHLRRVVDRSGRGRLELLQILGLVLCRRSCHTRTKDIGLFGRSCLRRWCICSRFSCWDTCSLHVNWQFEGV